MDSRMREGGRRWTREKASRATKRLWSRVKRTVFHLSATFQKLNNWPFECSFENPGKKKINLSRSEQRINQFVENLRRKERVEPGNGKLPAGL